MITQNKSKNFIHGGYAFFIMIMVYLTVSFLGQSILTAVGVKDGTLFYSLSALFSFLAVFGVSCYLAGVSEDKFLNCLNVTKFNPLYLAFALVLSVGMFFGLGFINGVISSFIIDIGLNPGGAVGVTVNNFTDFIVYIFTLALLPAIAEEIFFRGVMINGTKRGSLHTIFITSICFALYHGSFSQFVYQYIYGVMLAFLAIKAKSVLPCILAHFLNNFTVLLLNFLKIEIDLLNGVCIVLGLGLLIVFCVSLYFFKANDKKQNVQPNSVSPTYGFLFGIIAIAICAVLTISNLFVK